MERHLRASGAQGTAQRHERDVGQVAEEHGPPAVDERVPQRPDMLGERLGEEREVRDVQEGDVAHVGHSAQQDEVPAQREREDGVSERDEHRRAPAPGHGA